MNAVPSPGPVHLPPPHAEARAAWDSMLQRATTDKTFRSALLASPVDTMRQAGVSVPDGIQVTFIELDARHAYLFLPPLQGAS